MQKTKQIDCKNCKSNNVVKRGFAKNKLQIIQKYQCKDCKSIFTLEKSKGKTYPLKVILNAILTYNLGCTLEKTKQKTNKKYNLNISTKSINNWINEYKHLCTFSRLRKQSIKKYSPKTIIHKQTLSHIQPYIFKYHKAKLYLLFHNKLYNNQFHNISHFCEPLKQYLEKITTKNFPHHIFTYSNENNNEQRASQLKFKHLKIETKSRNNFACKLASLALNLANSNKERHQKIQDFFLINDSTTIAIEIPIYLTNWDAGYYRNEKGFVFPLNNYQTPITGHIDILQVRNGLIHILDYKPEAEKTNPIEQLTIYAMALSRKLNLPIYYFKAAWFDENNYYEFFPLHAVYEKQDRIETTRPIIIER
jgi:transposase-like protein